MQQSSLSPYPTCHRIPTRACQLTALQLVLCTTNTNLHSAMKPPTCGKQGTLVKHTLLQRAHANLRITAVLWRTCLQLRVCSYARTHIHCMHAHTYTVCTHTYTVYAHTYTVCTQGSTRAGGAKNVSHYMCRALQSVLSLGWSSLQH